VKTFKTSQQEGSSQRIGGRLEEEKSLRIEGAVLEKTRTRQRSMEEEARGEPIRRGPAVALSKQTNFLIKKYIFPGYGLNRRQKKG